LSQSWIRWCAPASVGACGLSHAPAAIPARWRSDCTPQDCTVRHLGDGLLVYFSSPLAYENDAQRAVRAGLGMLDALGQRNMRLTHAWEMPLAVRRGALRGW